MGEGGKNKGTAQMAPTQTLVLTAETGGGTAERINKPINQLQTPTEDRGRRRLKRHLSRPPHTMAGGEN